MVNGTRKNWMLLGMLLVVVLGSLVLLTRGEAAPRRRAITIPALPLRRINRQWPYSANSSPQLFRAYQGFPYRK